MPAPVRAGRPGAQRLTQFALVPSFWHASSRLQITLDKPAEAGRQQCDPAATQVAESSPLQPRRHSSPGPHVVVPHCTSAWHVPAVHVSGKVHTLPGQHAAPGPPHALHVPPVHTAFAPHGAPAGQQRVDGVPHAWHRPSGNGCVPLWVQAFPGQTGWLSAPHSRQVPSGNIRVPGCVQTPLGHACWLLAPHSRQVPSGKGAVPVCVQVGPGQVRWPSAPQR